MAAAPCRDASFPFGEYAVHKGYFEQLRTMVDAVHPLKTATRFDSRPFESLRGVIK